VLSVLRGYKKDKEDRHTRVEAGSNTSIVTLRVDGKGSLKSETVKYGLGPEKDYAAEGQLHIQKTPVFSSERASHKNKTVTIKE
jgi:hypothetical protein